MKISIPGKGQRRLALFFFFVPPGKVCPCWSNVVEHRD